MMYIWFLGIFAGLYNYFLMTSAEQLWLKNVLNCKNKTHSVFLVFGFIFHVLSISVIIFQLIEFHLLLIIEIKVQMSREYCVVSQNWVFLFQKCLATVARIQMPR